MRIWIDADACPNIIKDIVLRAAERTAVEVILVANQPLRRPATGANVKLMQVDAGFDAADRRIVELLEPHDLVITADIPLAALVIEKRGTALNPRGEIYTAENVRERLSMRNFMEELRGGGLVGGGPPAFNLRDRQAFANQLDTLLRKAVGARKT